MNEQLVRRADFAATRIQEGDRIEVVTFVGGG
ncbi:MAG TPA: sulfur carrier protein ThiS [Phycisphaerae bacterium]|nr:sulfur carrier protein ThiS [Phycisphaerae bacterium]HRT42552.1 sulfur carrier protein ThiS [Phycisphaerae bacterium]